MSLFLSSSSVTWGPSRTRWRRCPSRVRSPSRCPREWGLPLLHLLLTSPTHRWAGNSRSSALLRQRFSLSFPRQHFGDSLLRWLPGSTRSSRTTPATAASASALETLPSQSHVILWLHCVIVKILLQINGWFVLSFLAVGEGQFKNSPGPHSRPFLTWELHIYLWCLLAIQVVQVVCEAGTTCDLSSPQILSSEYHVRLFGAKNCFYNSCNRNEMFSWQKTEDRSAELRIEDWESRIEDCGGP